MACNNTVTPASSRGYIHDMVSRIEQLQKEAVMQDLCEGCEGGLVATFYNTKPVSFYLSNGAQLSITIPETATETTYFRIEDVKQDSVVLRLIDYTTTPPTCTNYTVILNLNCVCCLQCFPPICCEPCARCFTQQF